MRRLREHYITIILIVMVIAVNLGAFASYITNIKYNLSVHTDSHVDDIMDEAVECINLKLEEQINILDSFALFVSTLSSSEENSETIKEVLKAQQENLNYKVLEEVSSNGIGSVTGENYSEKKYYQKAMSGEEVLVEKTENDRVASVIFAVPVYEIDTDNVKSVLVAEMDVAVFSETIELSSFNQNGKVFVIKKDGTLISKSKGLSEANTINDIFPEKKYEDLLISSMRSRNSGIITYENDDTTRYIGYSKLSFNKWYVVCIISSSAVEASADDVETDTVILGIEIGIIFIVLVVYLIYNIVSINNKGRMNLERYYIASKYSDNILFDYSMAKDTMYSNERWEEIFGYTLPRANVKEEVKKHILSEDMEIYEENIQRLVKDKEKQEFQIRVMDKDEKSILCKVKLFPIGAKKGRITKIIGCIECRKEEL